MIDRLFSLHITIAQLHNYTTTQLYNCRFIEIHLIMNALNTIRYQNYYILVNFKTLEL